MSAVAWRLLCSREDLKRAAAEKAVEQVKSGMVLGLGTGSSAKYAIIKIGQLWQAGVLTDIVGIPTSEGSAVLARDYDIPLTTLDEYDVIDLAIDGADEIDPHLNLIKGLGGALLREKMIESVTRRFIVIADGSKLVDRLATRAPCGRWCFAGKPSSLAGRFRLTPVLGVKLTLCYRQR
jgi:ribose 5-phosphate isomerase A